MTAWWYILRKLAANPVLTNGSLTVVGSGGYVIYQDNQRYRRMMSRFAAGCLLGPVKENQYEITYFSRPEDQLQVRKMFSTSFSNQYYLIRGEIGSGKSRLLVEIVRDLVGTKGRSYEGAPVYVLASQGSSFAETLAKAVDFHFDEHINFKFALSVLLRVHSMPSKEEGHKLKRVLDAIEQAAFWYMQEHGRPLVLVIDDVGWLRHYSTDALSQLQVKAKLWADTNVAKLIFVTNDEEVEKQFQTNQSSWSRCEAPLCISDLSDEEAKTFLKRESFYEQKAQNKAEGMSDSYCDKIVDAVGGRIQHLIQCHRDWAAGVPASETISRLTLKARETLLNVSQSGTPMKTLEHLKASNNYSIRLVDMVKVCPVEDINELVHKHVVVLVRGERELTVRFESRVMLNAFIDMQGGK